MRRPVRVVVVGGGAAGVITAATMLRERGGTPLDVRIVERGDVVGPGLAYGTRESLHLLNNYAGRMSAFEDDPEHLVRWCREQDDIVGTDTFLPRHVYGAYLASLLEAPVSAGSRLTRVRGEVVGIDDSGADYSVTLSSGAQLPADTVVLALGNPRPRDLPDYRSAAVAYAANPWASDLTDRVARGARVLLVGTGLTTVDVAAQLANAHHEVEMVAVSRHGLLPLRHLDHPPLPGGVHGRPEPTVAAAFAAARAGTAQAGGDWRAVVEALKAGANRQWAAWSYAEQQRFLRHAARHWEIARHRMAPAMADLVEGLQLDGRLRVTRPGDVDVASFDLVVNCTGPAPAATPGWNPLVDGLAARGLLRPGPHGLGLDVSGDGRLRDEGGVPARAVHVVGAARRGSEWEVAAVPDIRRQARAVAGALRPLPSNAALVG
ncbi:MAG TPA: FAD/NAD(P)-binding protein [Nocardioides sp.]|uniref:FAD/NAD(P)-binding protein n=1 Tax=Nocardioides sp. TaxID=35761 RepID=UPI002D7EED9A|nr:FAD/NAD(P)-binding protein [Nocardioides sp.]HET6654518.1 FAD/NAD(P)-binding protein [Nocardioides sp.]